MDTQLRMQLDARMQEWNSVVEHERTLRRWKRLVTGCRAAARRKAQPVERGRGA